MSNKVKDIDKTNHTFYFFDDIMNIKNFDLNNIRIDKKASYKKILIYYIGYVTIKDLKYIKMNRVNPLYLIFNEVNGYFQKTNGNKYLTLVLINESKEKIKKHKELWIKIRELIRSITKNLDDYDKNYVKIKFNLDDELPLNKMKILFKILLVFHENNKYYPQVFFK